MVLLLLLLLLPLAALDLVLEGFFILMLENPLLFCLLPLDLSLFLLEFLDLAVEFLDFVVLDLAHLEGLLGVEFFSLFDFFVDEVLVSLLGDILDEFYDRVGLYLVFCGILRSLPLLPSLSAAQEPEVPCSFHSTS